MWTYACYSISEHKSDVISVVLGTTNILISHVFWCCYITVDFASAASQNGFCTHNLSLNKKANISKKLTKAIGFLMTLTFYQRAVVKQDQYITRKHRFVMQPFQNLPLCSSINFFWVGATIFCYSLSFAEQQYT
jgi:hypothetical protein